MSGQYLQNAPQYGCSEFLFCFLFGPNEFPDPQQQQQYPSYGQPYGQQHVPRYGEPQGSYGPPQGSYGPPPPQGAYGQAPPQPPMQPPHYPQSDMQYPEKSLHQGAPAQQAAAPGFITFKFSGTKPNIRDSRVTDPWGRTVLTVASTKKESTLHNMSGQVLAHIEWNHSLPRILYHGAEVKSKDLLPLERKSMIRGMTHEGQTYGWRGSADGMSVGLYHPSSPEKCLAYWHNEEHVIFLEASPQACETAGLLDMCLIAVFLMNCGSQLEDHGSSGGPNLWLIGALSALINAA
ncbi:hypothetical protein B0H19DRAFT_371500 [Mycena capillaripes]|nr:hypothetical protein B0H19DRAFT_371500 [Mycena capillaripes]